MSTDIEKIFGQVLVFPKQRHSQKILWRSNLSHNLHFYELKTITLGTASAAYLATRSLRLVGLLLRNSDPNILFFIFHDFHVDDLLTGGNTVKDARNTIIVNALKSHGYFYTGNGHLTSLDYLTQIQFYNSIQCNIIKHHMIPYGIR